MIGINDGKHGQALLLTVIIIAGVILMIATVSGLVMSYSIRQVTDAQSSAQAIFAADAGIECILYYHFCNGGAGGRSCQPVDCSNQVISNPWNPACGQNSPTYTSVNALYKYTMQCTNSVSNGGVDYQTWVSVGQNIAGTAARSLQIIITQKF